MPKYINADELLKRLPDDLPYKASVKRVLIQAPEADVAPRSEVEREIFEEIEEARERWEATYSRDHFGYGGDAYGYLQTDVDHTIYELKKKYTEGE